MQAVEWAGSWGCVQGTAGDSELFLRQILMILGMDGDYSFISASVVLPDFFFGVGGWG